MVVAGGLNPGDDAGSNDGDHVGAQWIRAQEVVGGKEKALGRSVETGSHDQLCRLRVQGDEDFRLAVH